METAPFDRIAWATSHGGRVDDEHRGARPTRRFERRAEAGDARTDSEHVTRLLLLLRNVLPHGSPIAPGSKRESPSAISLFPS